jgi:porin
MRIRGTGFIGVLGWFCIITNGYAQETPDYSHSKLTGDWGGQRTKLAAQGITVDIDVVQGLQKVTNGGVENTMRYGGSADYRFKFDFWKMGLWQGAFLDVQAEHQFGEFANADVGAILGTNSDGLFPLPDYRRVNVSQVQFTQFLSESVAVVLGKINTLDGDDNIFAGGRGKTNFMHQNFVLNPVSIRTVPYSALGAGAMIFFPDAQAEDPAILSFLVLGADGRPNTGGFGRDFEQGQTMSVAYRQPTRFGGLSGSHTFSGTYGTKDYRLLNQDPRLMLGWLLNLPVTFAKEEDSWSFMYNMHQYFYAEKEDPTQGFGMFARLGTADDKTNPFANFYSVGLGGRGMIERRDSDTWGLGYFYAQLSNEFGRPVERNFGDTQGMEVFYNVEVTRWLHVSPDFQYIIPGDRQVNDTCVAGVRVKIDL